MKPSSAVIRTELWATGGEVFAPNHDDYSKRRASDQPKF
jgi:hypothetical protein